MKVFRSDKVLLIEKGDLDNSIASKLRGHHVSYIIAPVEAKNNEMFLRLAYKELITVKYYIMSNQFTFITGEKGAALFNLAVLKYPAVELEVCYSNLTSNKMYNEELDEDGYPILVFVGRCNSL